MDSSRLPWLAVAGWLLLTLGAWGWVGVAAWWVWPLSLGAGLLLAAALWGWAEVILLRLDLLKRRKIPEEAST